MDNSINKFCNKCKIMTEHDIDVEEHEDYRKTITCCNECGDVEIDLDRLIESEETVEIIYKVGECDYCEEDNNILRPTPFMGDIPSMMCEICWENTRKEYAASHGEYIGKFDECYGYHMAKEEVITNDSIKDILESIIEFSGNNVSVEKYTLKRIEELEKENVESKKLNRVIGDQLISRTDDVSKYQVLNRELAKEIEIDRLILNAMKCSCDEDIDYTCRRCSRIWELNALLKGIELEKVKEAK